MITIDKLNIYKLYDGDVDCWARLGSIEEKSIMSDYDWFLIDGFIQDLTIAKNGLASKNFIQSIDEKLKVNCDKDETIQAIMELV